MKKISFIALFSLLIANAFSQSSHLLFQNSFEDLSSLKKWPSLEKAYDHSISLSDSVARDGRYSVRVEVDKGDPVVANGKRAEMALRKEPELAVERWIGFSIYLPDSYIVDPEPEIVMQWHDIPDVKHGGVFRTPPIDLMTKNGHWLFDKRWAKKPLATNENHDGTLTYDLGTYKTSVWTDWVFHIRFSYNDDGLVEIWQNGKLVESLQGPNCYNDPDGNYFKLGIYKYMWMPKNDKGRSTTTQRVVYYDDVKIGDQNATYNDVKP